MDAKEAHELLAQIREIESHGPDYSIRDLRDATALADRAERERDRVMLHRELEKMGPISNEAIQERGTYTGNGLWSELMAAGYDRKARPAVQISNRSILDVKAGSLDGGTDIENAVPARFGSPPLGIDSRYLFPRIRTQSVPGDATGISTYVQKSRTLGTPSDMIKAIDSTSAKEETDTVSEAVSVPLNMIANVSSGTPNILLANDGFRSWVSTDLLAAYRAALDFHIVDEIGNAGVPGGGGGANAFEDILYTQEVVSAAGYTPDTVVVSPADSLAIQLLQLTGGDSYVFRQNVPTFVVTTAVADGEGFVFDANALGTLYLGPFTFASFEENSGTTNTSTVRAESSGVFVVQRVDAAASLSGGS